jgi:glucokinase
MVILAGDIGGTKTHLALFEGEKWIVDQKYPSQEHKSLLEIVRLFLTSHQSEAKAACFGVAGPVRDGRCHATNLPWLIDSAKLSKELKISSVFLINDLEANAYGMSCLSEKDFAVLNAGSSDAKGNRALIAAGTGLGEAGIYWDGEEHHPFACEGGHTDFASRDEREVELWRYLKRKISHVSYERVLSGPGLIELFYFLIDRGYEKKPKWVEAEKGDLAKNITKKALNEECSVCMRTLQWFVSIYGSEAGNLALKFLALGGLYIGGGIAPKILSALKEGEFMRAFKDKGRFADLLSMIPIKVILNENTALLGAAAYARKKSRG